MALTSIIYGRVNWGDDRVSDGSDNGRGTLRCFDIQSLSALKATKTSEGLFGKIVRAHWDSVGRLAPTFWVHMLKSFLHAVMEPVVTKLNELLCRKPREVVRRATSCPCCTS